VEVHVRAIGHDLDRLESVRGDLRQVLAAQALMPIETRRHPELTFCHGSNHPL